MLSAAARPRLTVWLDALEEMPQLERLVIDSASPISPHFLNNPIYDAELPSLSHLDISGSVFDCGLALSHLILPALTSLRVTTRSDHLTAYEVKEISPYIWEHAHGYQDTEPLQSVFIHNERTCLDIVAWNTPSIDVTMSPLGIRTVPHAWRSPSQLVTRVISIITARSSKWQLVPFPCTTS